QDRERPGHGSVRQSRFRAVPLDWPARIRVRHRDRARPLHMFPCQRETRRPRLVEADLHLARKPPTREVHVALPRRNPEPPRPRPRTVRRPDREPQYLLAWPAHDAFLTPRSAAIRGQPVELLRLGVAYPKHVTFENVVLA